MNHPNSRTYSCQIMDKTRIWKSLTKKLASQFLTCLVGLNGNRTKHTLTSLWDGRITGRSSPRCLGLEPAQPFSFKLLGVCVARLMLSVLIRRSYVWCNYQFNWFQVTWFIVMWLRMVTSLFFHINIRAQEIFAATLKNQLSWKKDCNTPQLVIPCAFRWVMHICRQSTFFVGVLAHQQT